MLAWKRWVVGGQHSLKALTECKAAWTASSEANDNLIAKSRPLQVVSATVLKRHVPVWVRSLAAGRAQGRQGQVKPLTMSEIGGVCLRVLQDKKTICSKDGKKGKSKGDAAELMWIALESAAVKPEPTCRTADTPVRPISFSHISQRERVCKTWGPWWKMLMTDPEGWVATLKNVEARGLVLVPTMFKATDDGDARKAVATPTADRVDQQDHEAAVSGVPVPEPRAGQDPQHQE